jgi:hypothetical protein
MTINQNLLDSAEALRSELDHEGKPAAASIVTSLISELTATAASLAQRDAEAAENVARAFAEQRVGHYRDRAHTSEERLNRVRAVLTAMEADGNPAAPHLKDALR